MARRVVLAIGDRGVRVVVRELGRLDGHHFRRGDRRHCHVVRQASDRVAVSSDRVVRLHVRVRRALLVVDLRRVRYPRDREIILGLDGLLPEKVISNRYNGKFFYFLEIFDRKNSFLDPYLELLH